LLYYFVPPYCLSTFMHVGHCDLHRGYNRWICLSLKYMGLWIDLIISCSPTYAMSCIHMYNVSGWSLNGLQINSVSLSYTADFSSQSSLFTCIPMEEDFWSFAKAIQDGIISFMTDDHPPPTKDIWHIPVIWSKEGKKVFCFSSAGRSS